MNDLISRQAAIDALKDVSEHYTDKGREWHPHVDFMVEAIQDLPSAQPEIIRCKDCKHGAPNGKYGCKVYHYRRYETHEMKPDDFCSRAERRLTDG